MLWSLDHALPQTPDIGLISAHAMRVQPTFFDLATPLLSQTLFAYCQQHRTNTLNGSVLRTTSLPRAYCQRHLTKTNATKDKRAVSNSLVGSVRFRLQ